MIDCHLTATIQVHETPPVQETGREFATRSGDIQAVVRFITITINLSPSSPMVIHHPSSSSKPLSGSSPSSPYYSNMPLYLLYISIYFSKWRNPSCCQVHNHHFIIINTILQQHATYPDKQKKLPGLPKLQTTFKL